MNERHESWEQRRATIITRLPRGAFDLDRTLRGDIEHALHDNGHPELHDLVREARIRSYGWKAIANTLAALTRTPANPSGIKASHATLITWFPDLNRAPHELLGLPDWSLATT